MFQLKFKSYPTEPGALQSQSIAPPLNSATIETNALRQKPIIKIKYLFKHVYLEINLKI